MEARPQSLISHPSSWGVLGRNKNFRDLLVQPIGNCLAQVSWYFPVLVFRNAPGWMSYSLDGFYQSALFYNLGPSSSLQRY